MQANPTDHHPATPDSPSASSLDRATSTIDDLTLALTNFSRVPSPEPQICCCCGSEECEATKAWLALKSKLENRLVLSAEVGSALLQRHEVYVRKHEPSGLMLRKAAQGSAPEHAEIARADLDERVAELLKENAVLEKRLTHALLNNEVTEASSRTLLHELEGARSTVSRLSAHHARAVGLDTKLSAVLQENDDIRQERDSQAQRAKLAEARLTVLKDRVDKSQAEVRHLQDDLENRRLQRLESSESLLQDVRSRLGVLSISHVAVSTTDEDPEIIKIIESLVTDNETLKADNKELYKLLAESREDLQALQKEVEEQSIAPPILVETSSRHSRLSSGPSSFARDSEPLTPETGRRPLSPTDSLSASATKCSSFPRPQPRYPLSHLSLDIDNEPETGQVLLRPHQAVKAVQTDRGLWSHGINEASFIDHSSTSHDAHSDSSSLLDGIGSPMSSLLEHMHSLLHRMTHADTLTLTNRLKRQHLRGADVKHLSRTTVGNILSDILHLRAQYRVWLEDEKMTTLWTRKDLRGLFKLFREALEEMGQMRVTLNDVILEPSIAVKVSEMAMDPAKADAMEKERKAAGIGIGASWVAPFTKLFGTSPHIATPLRFTAPPRPASRGHGNISVSRPVPKTSPALAASATTVNVEFSGTGTGKSVTSVFSAHPSNDGTRGHPPSAPTQANLHSIMDIFAGAPHLDDTSDPWVVLPRAPRRVRSVFLTSEPAETGTATVGRSVVRKQRPSQLSRDVDAIIVASSVAPRKIDNSEVDEIPGAPLERILRRRGLSDSSIHSTFIHRGRDGKERNVCPTEPVGPSLEHRSVLRTLSQTVQNFKQVASHTISGVAHASASVPSQTSTPDTTSGPSDHSPPGGLSVPRSQLPRVSPSTLTYLIPSLTSWATSGVTLESNHTRIVHGGHRGDAGVPRMFGREGQWKDI